MPVSFKCECGKDLRVKDEFAGKKVKCPSCSRVIVTPEITAQDLIVAEVPGNADESQSQVKCQTCGAELKEEDPVCLKCGTIRQVAMKPNQGAREKNQASAAKPFYMKPMTWVAAAAILVCGILLYNNFTGQSGEESVSDNEAPISGADAGADTDKQSASKQLTPEKIFSAELQNKDVANLDKVAEHILKLREKSVPVLGASLASADRAVKLKSLYGLYILAYFKCYRPQMQPVVRDASRRGISKDEELSRVTLEILYLLGAESPEPEFLEFAGIAGKYAEQFSRIEKSPAAGLIKDIIIKQFSQNQSGLVKAKALTYLVLMGDKWNIRQVINLMKDAQGETAAFIKNSLVELTGCSFEKQDEWNKWYSANKDFPAPRWLINSLESASEPQRQKAIKRLMRITGKDFSYPENAPDEQKKEVINKWQELGKTLK